MAQAEDILPTSDDDEVPEIASRIMHAAIHLFGTKGYSATSVREIVQRADVTNPMLYYYFGSKEGLFTQLIEFLFGHMRELIEGVVQRELGLRDKLEAIVETHLMGVRESPEVLRFVYSAIFGPPSSRPDFDIHALHMRSQALLVNLFADAIESGEFRPADPGIDAGQLTEFFLGMINQELMRTLQVFEVELSVEERAAMIEAMTSKDAVDRIVSFFLRGAGTVERTST